MCVVSMVGNYYQDKWNPIIERFPNLPKFEGNITREEFLELKKEVSEMKELLKRAVEYDKKNDEPSCEQEEKVKLLKLVANAVGVDLQDVFSSQ